MTRTSKPSNDTAPSRRQVSAAEHWLADIDAATAAKLVNSWQRSQTTADGFSTTFYAMLFDTHPHLAALFPGDMQQQKMRMTRTLGEAIELATSPGRLILLLKAAGVRHHHYRVRQAYFQLMEPVFLQALQHQLEGYLDDELRVLWQKFFHSMTIIMRDAMAGTTRG